MIARLLAPLLVPALVVGALRPTAAAPTAPIAGPPAVCFPLEIGRSRSLPWEQGAFGVDPRYDLARLQQDAIALLAESDDTLVHMETLRRAAVYLSGVGRRGTPEAGERLTVELVSALRARVIDAVLRADGAEALGARTEALRWFDLGYLLGALDQVGAGQREPFHRELARAAALRGDDGALHLGVALASWVGPEREERVWKQLAIALGRADDAGGALRANLLATAGQILGCGTHEELVAEVRRHLG